MDTHQNQPQYQHLCCAVEAKDLEAAKHLLQEEHVDPDATCLQDHWTPALSLAISQDYCDFVELLLTNSYKAADVRKKDSDGRTPVHYVVLFGNNKLLKMLLSFIFRNGRSQFLFTSADSPFHNIVHDAAMDSMVCFREFLDWGYDLYNTDTMQALMVKALQNQRYHTVCVLALVNPRSIVNHQFVPARDRSELLSLQDSARTVIFRCLNQRTRNTSVPISSLVPKLPLPQLLKNDILIPDSSQLNDVYDYLFGTMHVLERADG